jgi:membrane fusion protein, multidrug efflux system
MNRKRTTIVALGLVVLVGLAWLGVARKQANAADEKAAKANAPRPIVVDTATVARSDVPIYLQGLGTVQAFYTVKVTARIDGELQKIAFTEGQTVQKGDLLAQIDPRPNQAALEEAVATKAKDTAQLGNARRDLERYSALQPEDLASKQTVDTQHATVDQLAAQLQVDQAQIDNARTQLDYTRITSPITGRTGLRLVDPGNIVRAADTTGIVVVTQVQPITVIFTLPEESLGTVAAALTTGPVEVTILSRDGGKELDVGVLSLIDNQIVQETGSARFKAVFTNTHNTLWPGQFVNARVLVRTDKSVITIPAAAVQLGPNGPFTYVVKSDSTVEVRPLKIGQESNGMTIVTSGLEVDEHVVTTNQYRLQAGAHVKSAADASGAAAAAAPPPAAKSS